MSRMVHFTIVGVNGYTTYINIVVNHEFLIIPRIGETIQVPKAAGGLLVTRIVYTYTAEGYVESIGVVVDPK